ncbi:MAG: hypothetical protein PHS17_04845 [Desulfobacterales bacterium]|nr:hypothetical protein [Desulfobacterales bacterium]
MLRRVEELRSFVLEAQDGEIGRCKNFLFDDNQWTIRYMVAGTGNWLPGRKVLLSTQWLRDVHWSDKKVPVDMTQERVRSSPEYIPERLDREYEVRVHRHYGLPPYSLNGYLRR